MDEQIDFNKNIDEINSSHIDISDMSYQGNFLNSRSYNTNKESVEKALNVLYTKARLLEDCITYAENFITKTVQDADDSSRVMLKAIEKYRDSMYKEGYISYNVPFQNSSGLYNDRDGSTLAPCSVQNGLLMPANSDAKEIPYRNVHICRDLKSYNNEDDSLYNDKPYRVYYMLDAIRTGGIKEVININLGSPIQMNYISINPVNCDVDYIEYILSSGMTEYDTAKDTKYIKTREITGVKVYISCKSYKKESFQIDKSRIKPNAWDEIAEQELKINDTGTIADIETYTGMEEYKKDYGNYINAIQAWQSEKAAIEQENKNNEDSYENAVQYWQAHKFHNETVTKTKDVSVDIASKQSKVIVNKSNGAMYFIEAAKDVAEIVSSSNYRAATELETAEYFKNHSADSGQIYLPSDFSAYYGDFTRVKRSDTGEHVYVPSSTLNISGVRK